jgi:cell wall-associated NlpC family hydrolase
MASLQESSLTNDPTPDEYGSIGYFQLIPSWGAEQRTPEAQLHWFIRQAVALKEKRLAQGVGDFGKNPDKYWEWIADVERPAEQYRHEYAKRLPEAQGLLEEAGRNDGVPKEKLFAAAAAAADQAVAGPSGKARTAVAAAMGQIGVDYAWGGGGPGGPGRGFDQGAAYVGFDCSSLMQYAMSKAGISLQRVAQDQFDMPSAEHVDVKHLQPGDLLFFGGQHSVHHVGMYIGNGRFIHAPHTGDKVKISQFAGYYMAEFAGARRYT